MGDVHGACVPSTLTQHTVPRILLCGASFFYMMALHRCTVEPPIWTEWDRRVAVTENIVVWQYSTRKSVTTIAYFSW